MRWRNFIYISLLALSVISHSALASFESELKKLNDYDIIYDSSKSGNAPFLVKAALFPNYSADCNFFSSPNPPLADYTKYVKDQNSFRMDVRSKDHTLKFKYGLNPSPHIVSVEFNKKQYFYNNQEHRPIFESKGMRNSLEELKFTERWVGDLRKGVVFGKKLNPPGYFKTRTRDFMDSYLPYGGRFDITKLSLEYKKILWTKDRFLMHLQYWMNGNYYEPVNDEGFNENESFSSNSAEKPAGFMKMTTNNIVDLASGAIVIRHTVSRGNNVETGNFKFVEGRFCNLSSRTVTASELGIEELVKEARAKREEEASRLAKLEQQRLEEEAKRERERLATLELERLKELERKRKEEILRKEKEKEQALESARRLKLERERKQKEQQKRRAKELAQQEKKRKEIANAKRLAEIEKKRKEAEALKIAAAKLKHEDAIAVIIGNRDYKGSTPDVDFAGNDADAMKSYILNKLGYRPGNVLDLRDASQADLRAMFGTERSHRGRLYDYVRADDSDVIVFYSGHGVPDPAGKTGYLLPVDADPNRAEFTGYPVDVLLKNLAKVPAKSMMVFIDACFSGDSPKGMLVRATSGLTVKITAPKKASDNMIVITAAEGDQFASWDEDAKHGLFTKHLLEALNGAADKHAKTGNKDGKVTLGEVKAYLDREMTYQARRRFSRDQHATVSGDLKTVLSAY